jgi:hypothetical protein
MAYETIHVERLERIAILTLAGREIRGIKGGSSRWI